MLNGLGQELSELLVVEDLQGASWRKRMTPEVRFWPEEITIQISMVRHTRSAQTVQLSEGKADQNLVLY